MLFRSETFISANALEDNVTFLGVRKDIPYIMSEIDVLVQPSLFEGLGIVIIEAQAAGTPCIVSTGVPHEVDMGLGMVQYIPLEEPSEWISHLATMKDYKGHTLESIHEAITSKHYNMQNVAEELMQAYAG